MGVTEGHALVRGPGSRSAGQNAQNLENVLAGQISKTLAS